MVAMRAILLRSPVGLGGILIAVIATTLALSRQTIGFNLWPDRVNGLTAASVLTGVVAAGVAAVEANRWEHANRWRLRMAARRQLVVRGGHALTVLLPLLLGYGLAVAIISVNAVFTGAYGSPSTLWLVSLACALLLSGTMGYVAGVALPYRWYVGPTVGLAFYITYVVIIIMNVPYGVLSLFPASVNFFTVFTGVITATVVSQIVFFVAVSALLFLLVGLRQKTSAAALSGLIVLSAAMVGAGATTVAANGQVTTGQNPGDFSCAGSNPELCVNTGYAAAGQALHSEFQRFNQLTAGTPLAASRLEQNVQGIGDNPSSGSRSVYLEQWASQSDLSFSVFRYVQKYGSLSECNDPNNAFIIQQVNSWLSGFYESSAGADDNEISRRLASFSAADGAAWFQQNYRAYSSCTLTGADVS